MRDDVGYAADLRQRTSDLVDRCRRQGMSESALARLPKAPVVKREVLPPVVLATKAHAINPRMQEAQRRQVARRRRPGGSLATKAIRDDFSAYGVKPVAKEDASDELQRAKATACMIAGIWGLEPHQMLQAHQARRFGNAKKAAAVIVSGLGALTLTRLGHVFGVGPDGANYLLNRGRLLIAQRPDVAEKHAAALAAICERWPEYRLAP